ncbi:unnamed protein product [Hermetia illucens]|uniref:Uncharacterized protein n=1 Tax=Hermetia illucens TaxID=343691 RepID=A0A7R8UCL9_HERIL|nr:unnamed protein product [Hermetia illucens]
MYGSPSRVIICFFFLYNCQIEGFLAYKLAHLPAQFLAPRLFAIFLVVFLRCVWQIVAAGTDSEPDLQLEIVASDHRKQFSSTYVQWSEFARVISCNPSSKLFGSSNKFQLKNRAN